MKKSVMMIIACILCLSLAACTPAETSRNNTSVVNTDEYIFEIAGIDHESLSSGSAVNVYMENKTESVLTFSVKDVLVDGKSVSAAEEWDVAAKADISDAFTVLQMDLNEYDMTVFTEVEFTLIIKSGNETLLSKVFTYNDAEKTVR